LNSRNSSTGDLSCQQLFALKYGYTVREFLEKAVVQSKKASVRSVVPVDDPPRDGTFVNSLARGLAVLSSFRSGDDYLTISQISQRVDVPRAAVRRALITLEALGYLASKNNLYSLSPKVLSLGHAYRTSNSLLMMSHPLLRKASARIGSPCGLLSRDGNETLCIASSYENSDQITLRVEVGARHPLYCTASGRIFLAHCPAEEQNDYFARTELRKLTERTINDPSKLREEFVKIRRQGYAIADREYPPAGYKIIAAPVYNHAGGLVWTIGTAVLAQTPSAIVQKAVIPALHECARELSPLCQSGY
jgi:IclR family pca regulon transcriptional regulator